VSSSYNSHVPVAWATAQRPSLHVARFARMHCYRETLSLLGTIGAPGRPRWTLHRPLDGGHGNLPGAASGGSGGPSEVGVPEVLRASRVEWIRELVLGAIRNGRCYSPCGSMASEHQHVEVAVELRPGADRGVVANWLRQHGLDALPLVVGLLATGNAAAVRAAFGTEPLGTLPVPDELREHVETVAVVPPKRLHERR
jgi:hypothetical protein